MSEWKKYKLYEIATLSNGINFDKSAYTSGVKLIGVADFKDRIYPDYESLQEVDSKVVRRGEYLEKGDIVFVRSNGNKELVGRCMMIDRDIPVTYSGFCIKLHLIDKALFEPVYFNYLFRTRQFRKAMIGTAVGANIQNLSQARLGNCEVNVPEIETQIRIATILSRYDSLIENYQKQIKLLEEAAQRLYKEWFVELRFPGHENTKMVDGLPEGWERKKLGEVAEFKRGKTITKKDAIEGIVPVVAGGLEPAYYCDKSNTTNRVITISGSGANAGYTRMYFEKVWASDCSFADTSTTDYLHFVFCFLRENKTVIDNMQKGAAQPHVYAKDINALEVLSPTNDILNLFEQKASKIFDVIASKQTQIRLLTEARDRLLPRLMGGGMEVDAPKGQRAINPVHRSGRPEGAKK
ncbi:MAG: restriction endonuclease subunit S [Bacteroidales bacterium]|nr:restriction endonuclease subunit S [Bacteroidales bacterium]